MELIEGLYPVKIREARYGVYEGGHWILTAGLGSPERQTDMIASDVPCREFWERVRDEGPLMEIEGAAWNGEAKEIYIASGNDVQELLDELVAFAEASEEYASKKEQLEKLFESDFVQGENEEEERADE